MRRSYNSTSSGVLPAGYLECEYIQSTGIQYISTGIIGRSGLSVETELANMYGATDQVAIGSRTSSGSRIMLLAMNRNRTTYPTINYGYDTYTYTNFQLTTGTFYKIRVSLEAGHQTVEVDGTTVYQGDNSASVDNGFPLFIFCCNQAGTAMYFAQAKMKRTLIKYNETTLLDLIPALRESDNKPGFYDVNNHHFYINEGSGEFSYQLKN